jgi:hypothetical protein
MGRADVAVEGRSEGERGQVPQELERFLERQLERLRGELGWVGTKPRGHAHGKGEAGE